MGEVMPTEQGESSAGSVQPKLESLPDEYDSSSEGLSPDADGDVPVQQSDAPPVVKRKGGRKPIYATSEERKQRNRQAQAAFRERRTEYIKQLEDTIKQQETTLQNLQQSHRSAADECLMLRYKNSLLERLLLEKGIDVQAELRMKGNSKTGPSRAPAASSRGHASPMQRAMMNRQQHARTNSNVSNAARQNAAPTSQSPTIHNTPSSHHSSPSTAKSPTGFIGQGGNSPTISDIQAQQQPQPQPRPLRPQPPNITTPTFTTAQHAGSMQLQTLRPLQASPPTQSYHYPSLTASAGGFDSTYFQKHYDQLEQEYAHDAHADMMVDQSDPDSTNDPQDDTFPPNFGQQQPLSAAPPGFRAMQPQLQSPGGYGPHMQQQQQQMPSTAMDPNQQQANIFAHGPGHPLFDPCDPMLDADPFGLTASMHFATPFTYDQLQQQAQANQMSDQQGQVTR